ncbi:C2 family cysteine protease [Actinoallomurus sp. NPDC052274]|uniref:C2 family cysteine protease n=1 Tax=Actinoallomurus sp. NPDC052274 TaxID=3155420 RepID=UPI0034329C28
MATDRAADAFDERSEEPRDQSRRPPPDRPGKDGFPSRAESRAGAAAANQDAEEAPELSLAPIDEQAGVFSATNESSEVATEANDAAVERDGVSEERSTVTTIDRDRPGTAGVDLGSEGDPAGETGKRQGSLDRPLAPDAGESPPQAERRTAPASWNEDMAQAADQPTPATAEGELDSSSTAAESGPILIEEPDATVEHPDIDKEESELGSYPVDEKANQGSGGDLRDPEPSAEVDPVGVADMAGTDTKTSVDARSEGEIEDRGFKAIPGEVPSDDNARVAGVVDVEVERGFLDRIKQVAARFDRTDAPRELNGVVDRPDFQDPKMELKKLPDRYGNPLERADGTRTPLFDGEPTREQTKQGRLGDCGIISTLGAVAAYDPEAIRNCIKEGEDGNYEVRLNEAKYSTSRMRYEATGQIINLTVTPDLPVYEDKPHRPAFADSSSTGVAWSPILEKAIAGSDQVWDDGRWERWGERWKVQGDGGEAPKGYVRLNQGSNPSDRAELLTQLTGRPAKTFEFPKGYDINGRSSDRQLIDEFKKQLGDHKPILVGTKDLRDNEPPLPKDLKKAHAYEVTKIDDNNMVHLRNPWNEQHPEPLTIGEFRASIRPRYSTLE